jgi:hypothetical protein
MQLLKILAFVATIIATKKRDNQSETNNVISIFLVCDWYCAIILPQYLLLAFWINAQYFEKFSQSDKRYLSWSSQFRFHNLIPPITKKYTTFLIGWIKLWNKNSGVQGKNNAYHNVKKVQNQGIYEWILNLIDIVVFVVFALYSRIVKFNLSIFFLIGWNFQNKKMSTIWCDY